jgi:hypothetical protein
LALFIYLYFVTRHILNDKRAKDLTTVQKEREGLDLYHYKWERRVGRESNCECSLRKLMPLPNKPHGGRRSLHFCIFFFASQREAAVNKAKVLAMTDSICQSMVMDGEVSAAITILESPSKEKNFSCNEATKEAASQAARASPKVGSQGGFI